MKASSLLLIGALASAVILSHAAPPPASTPNIVVILADDYGWGSAGCYGATLVKTPVLLVVTDEAERNAARFVLCGVMGQVRELFEMGGLLDAFTVHVSREEALAQPG